MGLKANPLPTFVWWTGQSKIVHTDGACTSASWIDQLTRVRSSLLASDMMVCSECLRRERGEH